MSGNGSEIGPSSEEMAEALSVLASLPTLDFIGKKIIASPFAFRDKDGFDKGYVLVKAIGEDNVVSEPIARIQIDLQNCTALLKALRTTELMLIAQQSYIAGRDSSAKEKVEARS